eukprot:CAMPEP_0197523152 /NCGR_PEP_ID=MMETSP1318-20131121/8144_1 /TAXON_ID=552666 /ORGANISM="Partenskyella glossopodia, Strain RCC365" /LENGTH=440 /DNA_ID=CAMNT_0043075755 /DNA_START=119 /DNA_END=1441 /DNA_ORIENTATION=-
MSYRQLRNFSEYMKELGYHRIVSMENFRTPNFELVADALFWLCERYDPTAEVSDDISTEKARVDFLKAIAQTMAVKARIKLNIKALYRADGFAVRELLKIAQVLHKSIKLSPEAQNKSASEEGLVIQTKLDQLKAAKNQANEIVESGSKLYGLLGRENELKRQREKAIAFVDSISMNLESNMAKETIERSIREQINSITDNVAQLEKMCVDLSKDQKSLQAKIERKQTDLDRAQKRLKSLKKVRPAFMEEYERLETELKMVYEAYLERFRNLTFLETELEKYNEAEREKQRESDRMLRRRQRKMKQEELRILRGADTMDEGHAEDDLDDDDDFDGMKTTKRRPGRGAGGAASAANVVGSMDGGTTDEDESTDSAGIAGEERGGERKQLHSARSEMSDRTEGSQFDEEEDEDEGAFTDEEMDSDGEYVDEGEGSEDPDDNF